MRQPCFARRQWICPWRETSESIARPRLPPVYLAAAPDVRAAADLHCRTSGASDGNVHNVLCGLRPRPSVNIYYIMPEPGSDKWKWSKPRGKRGGTGSATSRGVQTSASRAARGNRSTRTHLVLPSRGRGLLFLLSELGCMPTCLGAGVLLFDLAAVPKVQWCGLRLQNFG